MTSKNNQLKKLSDNVNYILFYHGKKIQNEFSLKLKPGNFYTPLSYLATTTGHDLEKDKQLFLVSIINELVKIDSQKNAAILEYDILGHSILTFLYESKLHKVIIAIRRAGGFFFLRKT